MKAGHTFTIEPMINQGIVIHSLNDRLLTIIMLINKKGCGKTLHGLTIGLQQPLYVRTIFYNEINIYYSLYRMVNDLLSLNTPY